MFKLWPFKKVSERWVRACITNVTFPAEPNELLTMLDKNERKLGRRVTDLESLLQFSKGTEDEWTAPRYMRAGDILLFYHGVSAQDRIATLQRRIGESDRGLAQVLARNAKHAENYAGKLFGCAEVIGPAQYEAPAGEDSHFKGRSFAPFKDVVLFKQPLPLAQFPTSLSIKRGVALTPVEGQSFIELKARLARDNRLPAFLEAARPGGIDFPHVTADSWRRISCAEDKRFSNESEVRSYLIDYLLDEIKDPGSPRLHECDCFHNEGETLSGIADYFIQLGGRWLPVEAKLNIHAERDILDQVQRYINLAYFYGPRRQRHDVPNQSDCLVIDQAGLYLCSGNRFVGNDGSPSPALPDKPLISRTELARLPGGEVRKRLLALIASPTL